MTESGTNPQKRQAADAWSWLAVAVIVLGTVWLRWHLLAVPLERDEGEYAYGGQLLLQGVPPYQLLYNMKLPGIYAVYALLLAIFGQSHVGVHLGLLCANSVSIVGVFLLGRRLAGSWAGIVAGTVFALLSMGQPVQGVFANAEHFVLVPVLAGLLALLRGLAGKRPGWIFVSGLLLGLGLVIKQHGLLFALWAGLFLLVDGWCSRERGQDLCRRLMLLIAGTVLPYLVTCLLMVKAGVFAQFWFWTIDYARAYATQVSWHEAWLGLSDRAKTLATAAPLPWLSSALGLVVCLAGHGERRNRVFTVGLALCSFLAVCPGFFFRPHYFVLLLPAAALLAGMAISSVARFLTRDRGPGLSATCTLVLLGLCLGTTLYQQRLFLFLSSPAEATTDTYWPNPFNESLEIARFIRANSKPSDTIAIIGSEPQIFFYAGRRSATGYIYMYPLMEGHEFALTMQQRLIAEVERASPEYLLFVRIPTSWLQGPTSHTLIYEWFTRYKEDYQRVGTVEIFEQTSRSLWGSDTPWPPSTPYWIEVLRRKRTETTKGG